MIIAMNQRLELRVYVSILVRFSKKTICTWKTNPKIAIFRGEFVNVAPFAIIDFVGFCLQWPCVLLTISPDLVCI